VDKSGSNVNLRWLAQPGLTYRVQSSTNLTAGAWTDVEGDVTASDSIASKTDVVPGNSPQRYYRVKLFR
jgi:hypothetical protein